jgi:hypothetical protein
MSRSITATNKTYSADFFEEHATGSLQSARVIVPHLIELVSPRSVIDIGCGMGTWLRVFHENGVQYLRGLDGPYVELKNFQVDPTLLQVVDLTQPVSLDDKFDLAVCVEVAEHLPPRAATQLITTITTFAPVVLFSAAVPRQGGLHHVNEQWPPYWRKLFADRGYQRVDAIRPIVWADTRVQWWYRQNLFLFANTETIDCSSRLRAIASGPESDLEFVHPSVLYRDLGIREALDALVTALRRRLWRKA